MATLLIQLQTKLKSKWPGNLMKGVLLYQENAPALKFVEAMAAKSG